MSVWVWDAKARRLEEASEEVSSWTLLAADSWFVDSGRVRAFDRHQVRFAAAAEQMGVR